ncbi:MAG: glycosyltransferase [Saprospiraceae bacterium]|nr:glycosyltransferase [Saprospiraceae bacterium]
MRDRQSICIVITNDIFSDQRIQRIADTLEEADYNISVFHRIKGNRKGRYNWKCKGINMMFKSGPLFYVEFNLRAFIYLIINQFDVITSTDVDTIIACRIAAWVKRKPLFFDAHEHFTMVPELVGRSFKQKIWRVVEKLFVRNLAGAYTVNQTLADTFTERYREPFISIRNLPHLKPGFQPQVRELTNVDSIILIYQGAINKGRGIELYIDALDQLPECELWIIGEGDLDQKIELLVDHSSSRKRIKIKGLISPKELPEITAQAHIGLNLLDPNSESYFNSLANRYYDYIKAGIPSIHMNFPEYKKANELHNTGILLSQYTLDALVHAIQPLIADPELYYSLSENCAQAIQENNWEKESSKLLKLYSSI